MKVLGWLALGAFALASSACASEQGVVEVSADEVAAAPEEFVGDRLWVLGEPRAPLFCSGAGCSGDEPCNNCSIRFGYGEDFNGVNRGIKVVDPEEGGLPEPTWTQTGRLAGGWCTGLCEQFDTGCRGNEADLSCAPSVPARIDAFLGELQRNPEGGYQLVVEDVRLAAGPTTQELTAGAQTTRLEEAEYPDGPRPGLAEE